MESSIDLNYNGERDLPGIDAREAAQVLDGFQQYLFLVAREVGGSDAHPQVRVTSYKEGSDLFSFVVAVAGVAAPFVGQASDIVDLLKSSIKLLMHLGGKPPTSIKTAKDGGLLVENNEGTINVFNQPTFNLIVNTSASKAAEAFVRRPLERRTSLDIVSGGKKIVSINRDDAGKFVEIPRSDILLEHSYETYLTVRTVVLVGSGVWRFNDGRHVINAKIEDERFLARVRQGEERFGHGDLFFVRLRAVQRKEKGALKTEYFVEEVLSHQTNPDVDRQSGFPL